MKNNYFDKGLYCDTVGDYELAINYYEQALSEDQDKSEDLFTNLSVIYWLLITDNNFPELQDIDSQLRHNGLTRYKQLVDFGVASFPKSKELLFWKSYFPYRMYFASFTFEECQILMEDTSLRASLVPTFYLNMFDEKSYAEERNALIVECLKSPTAKNKYIMSFLGS